jgi:DNA-directed RNA polymerase specialized sigma24 family protein
MQLSLFDPAETPRHVPATQIRSAADNLSVFADAVRQWRTACDADSHALAADAVAQAVLPHAERAARLAIPSMGCPVTDADDLSQELVVEVLAALPWAPVSEEVRTSLGDLAMWLSSTLLNGVEQRVKAARAQARHERAVRATYAAAVECVADHDEEGALRLVVSPNDGAARALTSALARLTDSDAGLLQARADGESWRVIAHRLRCSERTARRRYEQAVRAARLALHEVAEHGTPDITSRMLPYADHTAMAA